MAPGGGEENGAIHEADSEKSQGYSDDVRCHVKAKVKKVLGDERDWGSDSPLAEYLGGCEELNVAPNSEALKQIWWRSKSLEAPARTLIDQEASRERMLSEVFDRFDEEGQGMVTKRRCEWMCNNLNPSDIRGQAASQGALYWLELPSDDYMVTKEDFMNSVDHFVSWMDDELLALSIRELFAIEPALNEGGSQSSQIRRLFQRHDMHKDGSLPARIAYALLFELNPFLEPTGQWSKDEHISKETFLEEAHRALESASSTAEANRLLLDAMETEMPDYDLSRAYLGDAGCRALAAAVACDPGIVELDLASCGVRNATVDDIARSLITKPAPRLLNLSQNPISDGCVNSLVALLEETPPLSKVNCEDTYLDRGFSFTDPNGEDHDGWQTLQGGIDKNVNRLKGASGNEGQQLDASDADFAALNRRRELKRLFALHANEQRRAPSRLLKRVLTMKGPATGIPAEIATALPIQGELDYAEFIGAIENAGTRVNSSRLILANKEAVKSAFFSCGGGSLPVPLSDVADAIPTSAPEAVMAGKTDTRKLAKSLRAPSLFHSDEDLCFSWGQFYGTLVCSSIANRHVNFAVMGRRHSGRADGDMPNEVEGAGVAESETETAESHWRL